MKAEHLKFIQKKKVSVITDCIIASTYFVKYVFMTTYVRCTVTVTQEETCNSKNHNTQKWCFSACLTPEQQQKTHSILSRFSLTLYVLEYMGFVLPHRSKWGTRMFHRKYWVFHWWGINWKVSECKIAFWWNSEVATPIHPVLQNLTKHLE